MVITDTFNQVIKKRGARSPRMKKKLHEQGRKILKKVGKVSLSRRKGSQEGRRFKAMKINSKLRELCPI
jgi:hypothetical protein